MKFAMFYEIPVAKPWGPTVGVRGVPEHDRAGEARRPDGLPLLLDRRAPLPRRVLALLEPRGALRRIVGGDREPAARLRRAPAAEAVQPPGAHRRERRRRSTSSRAGASSSAPAARRPAPRSRASASTRTRRREMWDEALATSSAAGPTTSTSSRASTGRCRSAACTRSRCRIRTRRSGARPSSVDGHYEIGKRAASGCCRSPSATRPSSSRSASRTTAGPGRLQASRSASSATSTRATFTMVHCNDTNEKARRRRRGVVRLVPEDRGAQHRVARRVDGREASRTSATTDYAGEALKGKRVGHVRPPDHGLHLRQRRRRRRRPRPVHRDLQALRGRRLRAAVLPAEPVQDPARRGHALDRAARQARHPRVRR